MRNAATGWAMAIAAFVTYLQAAGRPATTRRLRSYYIERLARDLPGTLPYEVKFRQLVEWMSNDTWSPETRKSARASVAAFYRWAVETGEIRRKDNPARKLPTVSVPRALPRPVPDEVFRQALRHATDRQRLMLKAARYQGLRRAEIARIHLGRDFDWQTDEIIVRGKGGAERRVPLHPRFKAAVQGEIARREAGGHGTGWRYTSHLTPDGWLFPGLRGEGVTPDNVGKVLDQMLVGDWTGHTCRHAFATDAYAVERDLLAVQELLGHSKPETTRRYTLVPAGAKRTAVLGVGLDAVA